MISERWKSRLGDWAVRLGLDRLLPSGAGGGARFYNCGRQGARSWWARTDVAIDLLAALPLAAGFRLLDIGCGDEKVAAELARRGIAVDYVGFDLHPQSPRVRPLDLEHQAIAETGDVAVVLGVLEYLADPAAAMRRFAAAAPNLIVSHSAADLGRPPDFDPKSLNWRFYVDRPTFEGLLAAAGWAVVAQRITPDGKTAVWACRRIGA
jgi:SAM-dependent methyltransferase